MANQEHVDMLLRDGVEAWNQWREENPNVRPDLREANLSEAHLNGAYLFMADLRDADLHGADLRNADLTEAHLFTANLCDVNFRNADLSDAGLIRADLRRADLGGAYLRDTHLFMADLRDADLRDADLGGADLSMANLSGANLTEADLRRADLFQANLSGANLSGADLVTASIVQANLSRTTLTGCYVYGVSAWDVNLEGAVQVDLHLGYFGHGTGITVDHLEVAQFLYLLLHNEKMRAVLDTITSKVVLILGRFSDERKPILDALREALRRHPNGYIPVLVDFEPQADKPVLETVKILANLARFIIADLTDPHMVRAELTAIIPNAPTVPIQPIVERNANLPTEYESWALYRSVLPVYRYTDLSHLLANLTASVITPVEAHVQARRL